MDIFEFGLKGIGDNVQLGKKGPRVKVADDAGRKYFEVTTNDGSNLVAISAADPVKGTDVVTKRYMETHSNVSIVGQIDGNSPPPVVNGASYMCTTSGGSYIAGHFYYGDDGVWVDVAPVAGLTVSITIPLTGGTLEFKGDHRYIWDAEGSVWGDVGPGAVETKLIKSVRGALVATSDATVTIAAALPGGAKITSTIINVTTPFDGTASSTVGLGASLCVEADEVDLSTAGIYVVKSYVTSTGTDPLTINYTNGGATVGSADVEVHYSIV